jgi:TetR/AcrR family fatty acid metabolism transcriptional regulator
MSKSKDENKKVRILKAATKVFAMNGFTASKINQIAREAGVADGTIYLYFKNKDDLLKAVFEYSLDQFIPKMKQAIQEKVSPLDRLETFIQEHLHYIAKNREFSRLFQYELQKAHPFLQDAENEKLKDYLHTLKDIIDRGQNQGYFRANLNPWVIKHVLFGGISEIVYNWLFNQNDSETPEFSPLELDEISEQIFEVIVGGLQKPMASGNEKRIQNPRLTAA